MLVEIFFVGLAAGMLLILFVMALSYEKKGKWVKDEDTYRLRGETDQWCEEHKVFRVKVKGRFGAYLVCPVHTYRWESEAVKVGVFPHLKSMLSGLLHGKSQDSSKGL